MNGAMKATLFAIAVVLIGMAGSFIWFVATWDKDAEKPVGVGPAQDIKITENRQA